MIITIDAKAMNGKSTVARLLAKKINFKYFNTGAIYRILALEIKNGNINFGNLEEKTKSFNIDFIEDKVIFNGQDVSKRIREKDISELATKHASNQVIKKVIRKIQRNFGENNDVVMEGRDIGSVIFPNANIKFYLQTSLEVRIKRMMDEINISYDEALKNIEYRDKIDLEEGNFVVPKDAIIIDTTDKTIEEVLNIMLLNINAKL